jgi:hypothetical protein
LPVLCILGTSSCTSRNDRTNLDGVVIFELSVPRNELPVSDDEVTLPAETEFLKKRTDGAPTRQRYLAIGMAKDDDHSMLRGEVTSRRVPRT